MTTLPEAIAKAIFDEIERARMAAEPGISLARFEAVARSTHEEWRRLNEKPLPTTITGGQQKLMVVASLDHAHTYTYDNSDGITWSQLRKMK